MSVARRAAALAGVAPLLSAAAGAAADEALARRLVALDGLVRAPVVAVAERESAESCRGGAWWRTRDYALRARIDTAIRHASLRFAVDAGLIRAVIRHESNYRPDAVSQRGAMGLMQLMPETARELGVVCPFEPRENVLSGTRYLRELHNRFGSWPRALAAYHAGPARVAAGRVPAQTHRYVRRVVASWRPRLLAWIDLD